MKMKVQTWTTPLRYILMSIWFFCHLGLEDGSTSLTKKSARNNINSMQTNKCNIHMSLLYFFWSLSILRLSSFWRATSISLIQSRTRALNTAHKKATNGFMHNKVCNTEFYFNFHPISFKGTDFTAASVQHEILPELSATLYLHWLPPSPLVVATAALKAWVTSLKSRSVGSFFMAALQSSTIFSVTLIVSDPFLDFFEAFWSSSSSSSLAS